MKAIFLDMDGVLNSMSTRQLQGVWQIHPDMVERLNRICAAFGNVHVVLSSSWKHAFKAGLININHLLEAAGYTGPTITDTTPNLHGERGHEIQAWLTSHPEVTSFVILDDESDMAHLRERLVQTDFYEKKGVPGGLQDCHVEQAIKMLGEDPDES